MTVDKAQVDLQEPERAQLVRRHRGRAQTHPPQVQCAQRAVTEAGAGCHSEPQSCSQPMLISPQNGDTPRGLLADVALRQPRITPSSFGDEDSVVGPNDVVQSPPAQTAPRSAPGACCEARYRTTTRTRRYLSGVPALRWPKWAAANRATKPLRARRAELAHLVRRHRGRAQTHPPQVQCT